MTHLRKFLPVVVGCVLVGTMWGCEAMQGVNVGASVPIGGVVDVGVNKTIGDGQSKTPQKQQKSPGGQADNDEEEQETSEDQY